MKVNWTIIGGITGLVMFIGVCVGWAYDSGRKTARIDLLEAEILDLQRDRDYLIEFNRTQIEINASLQAIVSNLSAGTTGSR